VVLDLLRAVVAGALVAFLPGYAWSRVLFPATDRAQRAAVAVALAFTLVPTVALLAARLLGSGVTTAVAVASVLAVTLCGLLVWRFLGDACVPDVALRLPARPLGVPALVLLAAASLLGGGAAVGLLPLAPTIAPTAALVVAAGGAEWFGRWRDPRGYKDDEPAGLGVGDDAGAAFRWRRLPSAAVAGRLALGGALLLALLRGYSGVVLHDWPYLRGQDIYAHTVMTGLVLERGSVESFLVYPPGFHALVGVMSRLSGLGALEIFTVLAPALLLLPTLACYTFAARLLGPAYGIAAAFFAGAVLASSYLFFYDGTYVDLIAAQFLLVLALTALVLQLRAPSRRGAVLLALLGGSVVLYHSVTTIYLALLLAAFSAVALPYLFVRDRRRCLALFASLALLAAISLGYAWDTYDVPGTVGGLLFGSGTTGTLGQASIAVGTQRPRPWDVYLSHISATLAWVGLLGALLLLPLLARLRGAQGVALALLLGWTALLFAGSRTALSAFPVRFTRDLGAPLAITAAYAFVTILRSARARRGGWARPVAVGLISLSVLLGAQQGLARGASPSVVQLMTPQIEEAGKWLKAHNTGGNIVVNSPLNQATGNAMLALGGYAALPAYAPWQLRSRRQVPPRDREAVRDGHTVLSLPGSNRAGEILAARDVRYVVIYKDLNESSHWYGHDRVNWNRLKNLPGRYEPAFENDDVIIFAVKRKVG
jgi:hypothetical protein